MAVTASDRIPVIPDVIRWARESAGLEPEVAAKRLGVSAETLSQWESSELHPTIIQLRKAAKLYRRPLAVLLLPTPPKDFDPVQDFRTMPSEEARAWSPRLRAEFRRAVTQREVALELDDLGAWPPSSGPVKISHDLAPERAAAELRAALDLDSFPPGMWGRTNELLNAFVSAVERLGILVIQTQGVELSEMRGFSISEYPYPVVALNGGDWPRPRIFTLLHELAHLIYRGSGLCDLHEGSREHASKSDDVEHECNQVAAAVLMPRERLLGSPTVSGKASGYEWTLEDLESISRQFGASSEAALLRLVGLGRATWQLFERRKEELHDRYEEARRREKERQRKADGGPSPYVLKARNLGHGYVGSVLDAYDRRAISSLDVADYLDVHYDKLSKLEEVLRR